MSAARGWVGMAPVAVVALLLVSVPAFAQDGSEAQRRYQALIEELRCLVCQNQNIAESNAPLAEDLRREVRRQIAQGHSDDEIRAFLVARYGDYVLYRPPVKPRTWLLWAGPFALTLLAALFAWRRLRTRPVTAPTGEAGATEVRRLLDDVERGP